MSEVRIGVALKKPQITAILQALTRERFRVSSANGNQYGRMSLDDLSNLIDRVGHSTTASVRVLERTALRMTFRETQLMAILQALTQERDRAARTGHREYGDVSLDDLDGLIVYLRLRLFFASWEYGVCPVCRAQMSKAGYSLVCPNGCNFGPEIARIMNQTISFASVSS